MTDFNDAGRTGDEAMSDDDQLLDDVLYRADATVLAALKSAMKDDGLLAILQIPQPGTPPSHARRRRRPPSSPASTAPARSAP